MERIRRWLWKCGVPGNWLFPPISDPICQTCGKLRSVGCDDPEYCELAALGKIESLDPAAMAELMASDTKTIQP
jgi:hypothetical protein